MQTFAEGIHRRTVPFAHEVVTARDGERLSPSLPKPSDLPHVWSVAGLSQGRVSAWAKCQCVKQTGGQATEFRGLNVPGFAGCVRTAVCLVHAVCGG